MFGKAISTTAAATVMMIGATSLGLASTLRLPDFAPIPQARPEAKAEIESANIPRFPVVKISTTAEAIPEERMNVRVVGTRFLPPVDSSLSLRTPGQSDGLVATLEAASVWVFRNASSSIFGEAIAGQDVASIDADQAPHSY